MLDIEEVIERLSLSDSTVRRLVHDGKLRAYRIGRRLKFKSEDVETYIEGQVIAPRAHDSEDSTPVAPSLPPMIRALLSVLTSERTPVQEVYRSLGWERAQLEEVVNTYRDLLRSQGVRLYPAVKEQASGRQERYIEVTDTDGVLKRYSALSRDV